MDTAIAVTALITGLAVLATAIITLVLSIRNRKKVQEIHVLVNSRMAHMVSRVDQLATVLKKAGMEVPPPTDADRQP